MASSPVCRACSKISSDRRPLCRNPLQQTLRVDGVGLEQTNLVFVYDEHRTRRPVPEVEGPRAPCERVLEDPGESELLKAAL